jgi:hypothetical protein
MRFGAEVLGARVAFVLHRSFADALRAVALIHTPFMLLFFLGENAAP